MKKIVLLISICCLISLMATFAQTSASVLSPGTPTVKFSMTDSDQTPDASAQTQTPAQTQTTSSTTAPAATAKTDKTAAKDTDADHFVCTKEGCTHHHKKDQPCCKKEEKKEVKPTFMQDPNAPK